MITTHTDNNSIDYEHFNHENPNLPYRYHFDILGNNTLKGLPNWHEEIEILFFTKGEGNIICNLQNHPVKEGDAAILFPYSLHQVKQISPRLEYHCFLISPTLFANFQEFPSDIITTSLSSITDNLLRVLEAKDDTAQYSGDVLLGEFISLFSRFMNLSKHNIGQKATQNRQLDSIRIAIKYIRSNYNKKITITDLCAITHLSSAHFSQCFRKVTGYSFVDYLNLVRCEKAKQLLYTTSLSVSECAFACGFQNKSYFTRKFQSICGMLPSEMRKKPNQNKGTD